MFKKKRKEKKLFRLSHFRSGVLCVCCFPFYLYLVFSCLRTSCLFWLHFVSMFLRRIYTSMSRTRKDYSFIESNVSHKGMSSADSNRFECRRENLYAPKVAIQIHKKRQFSHSLSYFHIKTDSNWHFFLFLFNFHRPLKCV